MLIENFKVGGLAKYGLDYASIKAINPGIVYCSVTGFGQTGPYAPRAGYDFLVQGMGGLMSVTGEPDSVQGGGPVKVGVAISDQIAGMNALAGILAALVRRERTGEGDHIDVGLLDATVSSLINQASTHLVAGTVPGRMGNAHPTVVPYQSFATAKGYIILAIGNDGQFARFCKAAGLDHLPGDAKFTTNAGRIVNRGELIPQIIAAMKVKTAEQWIALFEPLAVPCGPINNIDQVFENPQVKARQMRRILEHPQAGPLPVVGNPVRMTSHDTTAQKAPPLLGEDTDAVLREVLGMGEPKCARCGKRAWCEALRRARHSGNSSPSDGWFPVALETSVQARCCPLSPDVAGERVRVRGRRLFGGETVLRPSAWHRRSSGARLKA